MTRNISIESVDNRNLKNILYEKSVFGAAPTHYKLAGDEDWHPIQFVHNARLAQIQFTDGTTISVQPETSQTVRNLDQIFKDRNDENTLDGLEADIEQALTDDLTTEGSSDYLDERAHFHGVGGAAAAINMMGYNWPHLRTDGDDPDPVPSAEFAETVPVDADPISDFLKKQHINPNPFGDKE